MRAVVATKPGGPEVLAVVERPIPEMSPGDLLVKVHATSVNHVDLRQRAGKYRPAEPATDIFGLDVAGEVVAVGYDAGAWRRGDMVCGVVTGGGYAEYAVLPAGDALPVPPGVDTIYAAALPEVFATAWDNLVRRGRLAAGETTLIHGGASGVGTAAIQLARLVGAQPLTTVAGAKRGAACLELGARAAIDYRHENFLDQVLKLTGDRGVNVVLDMVGQAYLEPNLYALAFDGRLVIIGSISGDVGPVDLRHLRRRRLVITGSTLRDRAPEQRRELFQSLRSEVWPSFEDGTIRPVIHAVYALDDIASAHSALEEGRHVGKILVSVV